MIHHLSLGLYSPFWQNLAFDLLEHRLWSYSSKYFGFERKNWRKIGGPVVVPSRVEKIWHMSFAQTQMNILWICLKPLRNRNSFTKFPKYIVRPNGLADGLWDVLLGFMMVSLLKSSANTENCMFFLGLGDRIRPRRISIGFVSLKTYSNLCFNWENNSKRWDLRNFLRQPQLQGVASLLLAKKHCFD